MNGGTGLTLALAGAILAAGPILADVVAIPASRDNTLIEDPIGALSNGAGAVLFAGRTGQPRNSIRRAVIAFDAAAAVPPGSAVTGAWLTLNLSQTNAGPIVVSLHRIESDWGEGTSAAAGGSGAPAALDDATWHHRFYADRFWMTPGGDFDAVAIGSVVVDQPGPYTWGANAGMVADVQSWIDDPAGNHGWLLLGGEADPSTVKRFDSREHPDALLRPALAIEYTPPCDPHPAAGPGYWQRQCLSRVGVEPIEPGFADRILPCADSALADLGFGGVTACGAIEPGRPAGCRERALRDLTSIVFNLCSGRVQTSCPAGAGGSPCAARTLGDVLAGAAELLRRGDCPRITACAGPGAGVAADGQTPGRP